MYNPVFIVNAFFYLVAAGVAVYAITKIPKPYKILLIFSAIICFYFFINYLFGFLGILTVERFSDNLRMVSSGLPVQIAGYILVLIVLLKGHRK